MVSLLVDVVIPEVVVDVEVLSLSLALPVAEAVAVALVSVPEAVVEAVVDAVVVAVAVPLVESVSPVVSSPLQAVTRASAARLEVRKCWGLQGLVFIVSRAPRTSASMSITAADPASGGSDRPRTAARPGRWPSP
jgi:hypothetical protein